MSVDDGLVQRVRVAAERVAAYQAELAAAQSEYARALRALAGTGAPPDRIAAALGLPEAQVRALLGVPEQHSAGPAPGPAPAAAVPRPRTMDGRPVPAAPVAGGQPATPGIPGPRHAAPDVGGPWLADERSCSFCGRPRSAVRKLILGPDDAGICDVCVTPATAVVRVGTPTGDDRVLLAPAPAGLTCAFCGKQSGPGLPAARGSGEGRPVVCGECVELCLEILAGTTP